MIRLAALVLLSGCATVNPYPEITGHREAACVAAPYRPIEVRIEWEDPRYETSTVDDPGVRFVRPPVDFAD